jgi:isopenicillin N synthase-like dioxygenase
MDQVPTIDIGCPAATELMAVDAACRDHGFFLLKGHGLDDLIDRMWQETRRFFAAPTVVKQGARRTEKQPLGYYDRELTKRRRDCKEVFDYMEPASALGETRNRWPAELPGFRETQDEFFREFSKLAVKTLELVHRVLGVPPGVAAGSPAASTVRLNCYPVGDPVPTAERAGLAELGETALGYHTDPGVLTLLLQDRTSGLQAHSHADGWIDVPPREGTIVVNLADSLQVWSNDLYRAAVHRVVPMTKGTRYSIPYFFNPATDAVIEPIAGLGGEAPRYRPFTWREFIMARMSDNFTELDAEDTQASHFRIA